MLDFQRFGLGTSSCWELSVWGCGTCFWRLFVDLLVWTLCVGWVWILSSTFLGLVIVEFRFLRASFWNCLRLRLADPGFRIWVFVLELCSIDVLGSKFWAWDEKELSFEI